MPPRAWKLVNAVTFVAVLAANGAAASGAMSGDSIGVIANRYPSLFLPANYVFGIWSLIYLGLAAFTVYQALPTDGATRAVGQLGPWWLVSSVLNVAWIVLFSFSRFGSAMLVMLALLGTLVLIGERTRADRLPGAAAWWCVRAPFALYLAWISVAVIANTFQYVHVTGWDGAGIAEATWAVTMMGVATALGWWMVVTRGNWLFPLVVAWALRGIGARHGALEPIAGAAALLVPLGVVGGAVLWGLAVRRARAVT